MIVSLFAAWDAKIPTIIIRMLRFDVDDETLSRAETSHFFGVIKLVGYPVVDSSKFFFVFVLLYFSKEQLVHIFLGIGLLVRHGCRGYAGSGTVQTR